MARRNKNLRAETSNYASSFTDDEIEAREAMDLPKTIYGWLNRSKNTTEMLWVELCSPKEDVLKS